VAEGELERLAVIDLGSNSFRLVVFGAARAGWWRRTDEIYDTVRIGAGLGRSGKLAKEPMARAVRTLSLYAHFCRAAGVAEDRIRPVATSAIREAINREVFLARAREAAGVPVRVLSRTEEASYGYVAAVNSTTLDDGAVLDLGGGSMQLVEVCERRATHLESWPLGAVRMTERFLPDAEATKKELRTLRKHALEELETAGWLPGTQRIVGLGGTVRNLAAAAQLAAGLPSAGVQGFILEAAALDALIAELAARPAAKRGRVPGIKPGRGDVILAGAVVVRAVLEAAGAPALEVTEAGLREGVFLSEHLAPAEPPLLPDVREASVRNLAARYHEDLAHPEHVARLALQMWDGLAAAGVHPGEAVERELLRAAALLHDIGMTVDYDDHHKHSRYLILNAGLPGFSPREVALVAQMARYHRKGEPGFGEYAPLMRPGDEALLRRCAALLRLAEQLERSRDQLVHGVELHATDGRVRLSILGEEDASIARWGAAREAELFARAFGRELEVR